MRKSNKLAIALMLSLCGSSLAYAPVAAAAEKCPIEKRQSKAVGQSVAKKVQRSFKAYQEGNLNEAINVLLEANPKNDFDKAYVDRMLGNFYAEQGKMKTAVKYLGAAVKADILGGNDHAGTMRLYADLLLQEKQFKQAIPYYYDWMEFTCKQDATVYKRIGVAYTETKQWDKVLEVANTALKMVDKPDKGLYQMKLTAYFNKKQYKNAVGVLETMVPLWPSDGTLWVQLAQFYLITENYKKALVTYDIAYKGGFLTTAANITRLTQLMAQNNAPYQASKIFIKHMNSGLIEKNAKNYKILAGFYHNAKELPEAAKYYGMAAEMDNDGELYLKQGRILALDEKTKTSIPVFKKALDAGLKNPGEAQFELALAYLTLKQYKSAYSRAKLAANDKKTARSAKSYISYIKEKARVHNVAL